MSVEGHTKWYIYVGNVQLATNSTYSMSINTIPFNIMFEVEMRTSTNYKINKLIENAIISQFNGEREQLRQGVKEKVIKIQVNLITYDERKLSNIK